MRNYNNMSYVCKCNVFLLELQIKSVDSRILSTNRQDLVCPRDKWQVISEKFVQVISDKWEVISVITFEPWIFGAASANKFAWLAEIPANAPTRSLSWQKSWPVRT